MTRTDEYGRDVHDVRGPFELMNAKRTSPDEGGTLDRGIIARLEDGRRVVVGELWAMGPDEHGARISLDSVGFAQRVVEALNDTEPDGSRACFVIWSWEHDAWWGPNERGYVPSLDAAGRYTARDAGRIVTNSYLAQEFAMHEATAERLGAPTHGPWGNGDD